MIQVKFEMFGPYAGENKVIKGHRFHRGIYEATVDAAGAQHLINYLRYWGAFLVGSPEWEKAKAAAEAQNGVSEQVEADGEVPASSDVQRGTESTGGESPEAHREDVLGGEPASAEEGEAGLVPGGDGLQDAGMVRAEGSELSGPESVLHKAILSLDPENDAQWTRSGKPALDAIEAVVGANVTRSDVDSVALGYDRAKAMKEKMSDL